MEQAIKNAGLSVEDIDYINTHGTSTPMGDPIETSAITQVFGEHAKDMAVTSTKGATRAICGSRRYHRSDGRIQAIREGIVPPTLNLEHLDEACAPLNYVPEEAQKKEVKAAMSNSFGFGGQSSSVIFKVY